MDWSFFITYSRDLGITLYDIKFKGERIIYELGLKEALTHYAGNDPYTASTAYLDSYIGMGVFQFQLVEGYDVPFNSTLLDIIYHTAGNTVTQKKALAVFEIDNTMPLQHHAATSLEELEYDWTWISSIKSPLLVVRAISSLGNYDYLFDYIFYLDGTIEVKTAASGYLQAMYYTSMENTFGTHVHNTLDCGIHTHFFSYKVDLDVCGKNNSFQRVNMVPVEVEYPFFKDIEPGKFGSFQLQRDWVANEDFSRLHWPENGQGAYLFLNQNITNTWGEYRAYRLMPGHHGTVSFANSTILKKNAQWYHHHVSVTLQKDTEPSSSAALNQNLPWDPLVDFDQFFNGEDLNQTDLVVWVTLGMNHFANSQDIPNTVYPGTQSSFMLIPFNYFDREPASNDATERAWIENHGDDVFIWSEENQNEQTEIELFELNEW
jgi:primary-amine oxidase